MTLLDFQTSLKEVRHYIFNFTVVYSAIYCTFNFFNTFFMKIATITGEMILICGYFLLYVPIHISFRSISRSRFTRRCTALQRTEPTSVKVEGRSQSVRFQQRKLSRTFCKSSAVRICNFFSFIQTSETQLLKNDNDKSKILTCRFRKPLKCWFKMSFI